MADITQSSSLVYAFASGNVQLVKSGEAIVPGDSVYLTTDSDYKKADALTSVKANSAGVSMGYAPESGVYFPLFTSGQINIGSTALSVGETYTASTNAGKFAPTGDVVTGSFVTRYGEALTNSKLALSINATGIQRTT